MTATTVLESNSTAVVTLRLHSDAVSKCVTDISIKKVDIYSVELGWNKPTSERISQYEVTWKSTSGHWFTGWSRKIVKDTKDHVAMRGMA